MPHLIQLPDGSWMRPEHISSIIALDHTELTGGGYCAARVIIRGSRDECILCECADYEAACNKRDALAAVIAAE